MANDLHRILLPRLALLWLGCTLSLSASAQVYKCVDVSGKTAYQSQPCPESTRSAQLDVRSVSALPVLPANASWPEVRQALVSNCMTQGMRSEQALSRIAREQPGKFRNFCDCSADGVMAELSKLKDRAAFSDMAAMERLGFRVGISCASRLQ